MNCPKCGEFTQNDFCNNCNIDVVEYALVDKMSFDAYNRGLTYARNNEIDKAISELTTAIKYNSENITALNLLGICYDRVGKIADASKYWIMSCLVIDENIAQLYLKKVEEKSAEREKLNDAIKSYNKALVYLKQNSEDMALIQLKKAIELSKNFTVAMNLTSLIYIKQGEQDKAISLLKKVLEIDKSNETALSYLDMLNYKPTKQIIPKHKEPVKETSNIKKPSFDTKPRNNDTGLINKSSVTGFGLGLLVMLIVAIFLIIPNVQSGFNLTSAEQEKSYKEQIEQQNILINSKDAEISNLKTENDTLKTENSAIKTEYTVLKVNLSLINAKEYYDNRDYQNAADEIYSIDTSALKPEQIDRYNELKTECYPLAAKSLYDSGVKKYDNRLYDEALALFEKSISFGGTDKSYYPSTLFYMGRCYEGLGNIEQAKVYYQKIIDEYPNKDTAYSARSRLNTIS